MRDPNAEVRLNITVSLAFDKFVNHIREWWPQEYTWSQDVLEDVNIDPREDGLVSETGPFGFRIDWGRVVEYLENQKIAFTWQISEDRQPLPDPDKASLVTVDFTKDGDWTKVQVTHTQFENHGDGFENYQEAMSSPEGWPYIMKCFRTYCEQSLSD